MENRTLCIPVKGEKILLGIKKRGFGEGKLNGFGGHVEEGESIEEATVRELYEEVGLKTNISSIKKVGEIQFGCKYVNDDNYNIIMHIFLVNNWENSPKESEEMGFEWFNKKEIPFDKMWDDDKHWLLLVLEGKRIKAKFSFKKDGETIETIDIKELGIK